MAIEWFYRRADQAIGPLDANAIRALAKSGSITPTTLVRRGHDAEWIMASRIKGLFEGRGGSVSEPAEATERDPLVAMASDAASAVASSAGAAAKAIGGALTSLRGHRTDEPATSKAAGSAEPSWVASFTRDDQSPEIVAVVAEKVKGILMSDESLLYIAVQNKPVVNWKPDCIALTNRRFIFYRPKLFGRVDFEDYVWRELHDARLSENVIGSTFSITAADGRTLSLDYLPKAQARAVYRMAQEAEEAARTVRRTEQIEHDRAKAGGVVVQANIGAQAGIPPTSAAPSSDPMEKLGQLKRMLDAGLITSAEFDAKKLDILSRM